MTSNDLERGVTAARSAAKLDAKFDPLRRRHHDDGAVDPADHADALHDPERRLDPLKRKPADPAAA